MVAGIGAEQADTLPPWFLAFAVGCGAIVSAVAMAYGLWAARRRSAWWISDRLATGRACVRVRTTWYTGAWNPAHSGSSHRPENRTPPGRGRATYTLTPDGLVHADVVSSHGGRSAFLGPVVARPARSGRTRRHVALAAALYIAVYAIGAVLGYAIDGPAGAGAGFVLTLCAASFVVPLAGLAARRRDKAAASTTVST